MLWRIMMFWIDTFFLMVLIRSNFTARLPIRGKDGCVFFYLFF